jgi:sterol desaturase/sphingolipid hydroxylase (fatty acid hydroxylase superfamily)
VTEASRAELRAELLSRVPRWYSPWLHAAFPTFAGIAIAGFALSRIHDLRPWQLAFVPLFLLFGNAVEWHAHRGMLHRRVRYLEVFFVRHTPQHHGIFVATDMSMRSARELKFVLLPAYGILGILALTSPLTFALAWLGQPNLAALWVASVTFYVLSYEWLHLAYHLPQESWLGRTRALAILRRHHQTHHAPQLMHRWNFNVTLPFWDLVRGTVYRGAPASARGEARNDSPPYPTGRSA